MQLFNKFKSKGLQFSLFILAHLSAAPSVSKELVAELARDMGLEYGGQVLEPLLDCGILCHHPDGYALTADLHPFHLPMSEVERQYLRWILTQPHCSAFLPRPLQDKLAETLADVPPLEHIQTYAPTIPADCQAVQLALPLLLQGIRQGKAIHYRHQDSTPPAPAQQGIPWRLEYVAYRQSWHIFMYSPTRGRMERLPLSALSHLALGTAASVSPEVLEQAMSARLAPQPIVLTVRQERGALERCFLAFQHREFLETRQLDPTTYTLSFQYDAQEEDDLLRTLLLLGSCVTLQEPPGLKQQLLRLIDQALQNCN